MTVFIIYLWCRRCIIDTVPKYIIILSNWAIWRLLLRDQLVHFHNFSKITRFGVGWGRGEYNFVQRYNWSYSKVPSFRWIENVQVNSLVISRLDYCNSLLYDIPKYQRDKLQRIQNTAARMITGARSSDHITPLLKSLHWLPVEARIHFKIFLITYKILKWTICWISGTSD